MKATPLIALLCSSLLTIGCSDDLMNDSLVDTSSATQPELISTLQFAQDDGAKDLTSSAANKVYDLLKSVPTTVADGTGEISITSQEYQEIKAFTDDLVKDCKTNKEKYTTIFNWLYKNLEYKHEYEGGDIISNDPYPVFKSHVAICQGFSNLHHIMTESQGMPTLNVNGIYVNVGGHAWNYVYVDNEWWVSDATNNGKWPMEDQKSYSHLQPQSIDANLFETEECTFNFYDEQLNINEIKTTKSQFIVPFSAGGYKVTSLNPQKPVPTTLKEIYFSKNIQTIGQYYRGLEKNAPSIEAAYVDPENPVMESYSGAVYVEVARRKQLAYLPARLKKLELLPIKILEKNVIYDHQYLEELIIPNGTRIIKSWAFEKCPNLRVAYIPDITRLYENAFYGVHPDFKIVREDMTGIVDVTL